MSYGYQDALAFGGITEAHPGGFSLTKSILKKEKEKIKHDSIVLDAGCGMGLTASFLVKEIGCNVIAVDIHPQMIEKATERFLNDKLPVKIQQANLEKLPFPDNYFDFILAESSIIFTDISKTIKEFHRVLKPSGTFIAIELTLEETLLDMDEKELKEFYGIDIIPTEQEWLDVFKRVGFNDVAILKKNTILDELENVDIDFNEQSNFLLKELDPEVEDILLEHSRIMMEYAEELGYRVFKVRT